MRPETPTSPPADAAPRETRYGGVDEDVTFDPPCDPPGDCPDCGEPTCDGGIR